MSWLTPSDYYEGSNLSYCLIDTVGFGHPHNRNPIPEIMALPQNPSYLRSKLNVPSNVQFTTYEQDHGSYIERYVMLEYHDISSTAEKMADPYYETEKILLLEAYHPKDLEPRIEKQVVKALNRELRFFSGFAIPAIPLPPDTDDDEENLNF